jgi:hypothetical protein
MAHATASRMLTLSRSRRSTEVMAILEEACDHALYASRPLFGPACAC